MGAYPVGGRDVLNMPEHMEKSGKTNSHFIRMIFDERFFNSAHPSLRLSGYLLGNEPILLEGLLPESSVVVTALPDYRENHGQDIEGELLEARFDIIDY